MSERNGGWTITDHAWDRMTPMGLGRLDVLPVLLDPEQSYDQGDRDDRRVLQRADLAVVVDPVRRLVVTVLWRCQEEWFRRTEEGLAR